MDISFLVVFSKIYIYIYIYIYPTGRQNFGDTPGQIPRLILTLCRKQVSVNREDAKLHWVHLLDFSPLCENMFQEMGVLFKQV